MQTDSNGQEQEPKPEHPNPEQGTAAHRGDSESVTPEAADSSSSTADSAGIEPDETTVPAEHSEAGGEAAGGFSVQSVTADGPAEEQPAVEEESSAEPTAGDETVGALPVPSAGAGTADEPIDRSIVPAEEAAERAPTDEQAGALPEEPFLEAVPESVAGEELDGQSIEATEHVAESESVAPEQSDEQTVQPADSGPNPGIPASEAVEELSSQTVIATDESGAIAETSGEGHSRLDGPAETDSEQEPEGDSELKSGPAEEESPERDDDSPAVITTLEYLYPPKKEGEEDTDQTPEFSGIAEAKAVLEGFLFTTNEPLSVARLSKLAGFLHPHTVRGLLLELQMEYDGRPGGLQIVEVAGGFQMATRPHIAEWMFRLHKHRRKSALSPATLETLAIIAYKQPVTKGEVEAIRGVESSGTFRTLQDLNLIDVGGRREVPGRPQLFVTTPQFLKAFGLNALADLPSIAELRHRFADDQRLKAPLPAPVKPAEKAEVVAEEEPKTPATETEPATGDIPETGEQASPGASLDADTEAAARAQEAVAEPVPETEVPPPQAEDDEAGEEFSEEEDEDQDEDNEDEEDDEDLEEEEEEHEAPFAEEEIEEALDEVETVPDEQEEEIPEEEELPPGPEDEVPPPSSTVFGRVPKPPRKGGWGIGRPIFDDEED